MQRSAWLLGVIVLAGAAAAGCHGHDGAQGAADAASGSLADDAEPAEIVTVAGPGADAGPSPVDAPRAIAIDATTPVFSATEWPPKDPTKAQDDRKGEMRLGYLRKGARVAVKPELIKKANCAEGWYELESGGFVCGKFMTRDEKNPEIAKAPAPPLTDGPLPFKYGMNLTNGTPMYRRLPTKVERRESEKGLAVGRSKGTDGAAAAGVEGSDVPWYLKDQKGQKPTVSFDDLKGERGLIFMRMVKGFYVSLDHESGRSGGMFWVTQNGLFVAQDHVLVHKSVTEFEGVKLAAPGETRKLPLAWITSPKAWRYTFDADKKRVKRSEKADRFTILQLTGNKVVVDNRNYYETSEGWYTRDLDGTRSEPGAPPGDLAPAERWIDVNLKTQTLVAYEGTAPVYATIVSTGRHNDQDKTKDHRTVTGSFRIREKHVAATMDDDSAGDGTYSIQDVPWIMYFQGSYALHGAFWHSSFGRERSHGCVNLTPFDAKNLFQWVGPRLPDGWHGVHATEANPGTRVVVHDG
jgi:hypothetical protein